MMITVGIDFGTGNSVLSYCKDNESYVYSRNGQKWIPSDILIESDGYIECDHHLLKNPPDGYSRVSGIKRNLLCPEKTCAYNINELLEFAYKRILYLFEQFTRQNDEKISQAVLTCPAHASQSYRELLIEIGSKVGLNELAIIDEPTAAAVHQGLRDIPTYEERFLVVDWGCGTCDISLIERYPGNSDLNVKVVRGDNHLGGLDMDHLLRDLLAKNYGFNPEECPLWQIEEMKIHLSANDLVEEELNLLNNETFPVQVSRNELEDCIQPLIVKSQELIREALEESYWKEVDYTIATGGPMLMPAVRRAMNEILEDYKDEDQPKRKKKFYW